MFKFCISITKKMVIILAMAWVISTALFLPNYFKAEQARKVELTEIMESIDSGYKSYLDTRGKAILYACTQNFAGYQGIELTTNFYQQASQYSAHVITTGQALQERLISTAKYLYDKRYDEEASMLNNMYKNIFQYKQIIITSDTVTSTLCHIYQDRFFEKVTRNIAHYRV